MRWLDGIMDSRDINLSKLRETVKNRGAWHEEVPGVEKSGTRLKDNKVCLHTISVCKSLGLHFFMLDMKRMNT